MDLAACVLVARNFNYQEYNSAGIQDRVELHVNRVSEGNWETMPFPRRVYVPNLLIQATV